LAVYEVLIVAAVKGFIAVSPESYSFEQGDIPVLAA